MSNAVNKYVDDDGRVVVYGFEDEISAVEHTTLDGWREEKQRKAFIANGPVKNYVNCYHEPVAALNDILEVSELGAIMKLIPYVRMNTEGALYYGSERMTIPLIGKAIDRSVRQSKTIVAKLFEEGVLKREKVGRSFVYNVDERYHSMGYGLKGAQFTKVMQIKTRADIRNISVQAAGVLYKMLPFFNYEHFVLCTNPNELNEDNIYPISHREFSDIVRVDRSVIDSGTKELMRFGFLSKFSAANGELYIVNPDIATRRKDIYDESSEKVRSFFRMVERQGAREVVAIKDSDLAY